MTVILTHWFNNNDHCCLTTIEKKLRREHVDEEETFIGRILYPFFGFNMNHKNISILSYSAILSLSAINAYNLINYNKSNK